MVARMQYNQQIYIRSCLQHIFFQSHFFDEYAMEGVSPEANEIYLEVAPDLLLRSLKTAHSARWLKIKLTKKHTPCLTFEIDLVNTMYHFAQYCS